MFHENVSLNTISNIQGSINTNEMKKNLNKMQYCLLFRLVELSQLLQKRFLVSNITTGFSIYLCFSHCLSFGQKMQMLTIDEILSLLLHAKTTIGYHG